MRKPAIPPEFEGLLDDHRTLFGVELGPRGASHLKKRSVFQNM
jgi:hypothetical protein